MSGRYNVVRLGEDSYGSEIYFDATNISARKVPGTVKQIVGKRIVSREVLGRDILDWNITVEGVYQGNQEEIESFKSAVYYQMGQSVYYNDGTDEHTGSYVIDNNGVAFSEPAESYEGGTITFSIKLKQLNQQL